jgi:two-component system, NarL family, nitrate/nitrite response regulator NarL
LKTGWTKFVLIKLTAMNTTFFTSKTADAEPLTRREREIMALVAVGKANKEIASHLYISNETVKKHMQNIFQKLGAHNKIEALNRMFFPTIPTQN